MTARRNLVDIQFGRWTALSYAGQRMWWCRCECGLEKKVDGGTLWSGRSQGCIKCHTASGPRRTHGEKRTRLYTIWSRMIGRCENPNDPAFERYGNSGIAVCRAWRRSFQTFKGWALANGYAAHLTVDRRDGTKGYEPSNCRWATYKEQNRNRRDNKPIIHNSEVVLIPVLAERHGLPADAVKNRIRRYGWTVEKALSTPVNKRMKREPWIAAGMSRSAWYRAVHKTNIDQLRTDSPT